MTESKTESGDLSCYSNVSTCRVANDAPMGANDKSNYLVRYNLCNVASLFNHVSFKLVNAWHDDNSEPSSFRV